MRKNGGFTLIEILIALLVFAIMATVISGVLYHALNTQKRVEAIDQNLANTQRAAFRLTRDLKFVIHHIRQDSTGHSMPPVLGSRNSLQLIETSRFAPADYSGLSVVQYQFQDHQLFRTISPLTPTWQAPTRKRMLLSGIKDFRFNYVGTDGVISNRWPNTAVVNQKQGPFPKAVTVSITLATGKQIHLQIQLGSRDERRL
jgi:general secretion pathway protein J